MKEIKKWMNYFLMGINVYKEFGVGDKRHEWGRLNWVVDGGIKKIKLEEF